MQNSQPYLQENLELILQKGISIYKGKLTQQSVLKNIAIIKKAFPLLPLDFYDVFIDRIKANGFTDERLTDAVNHVIDTCPYPTPTIANFISFDKKISCFNNVVTNETELR